MTKSTDTQDRNVTDGGQPLDRADVFTQTSDVPDLTTRERVTEWLDIHLYAPLMIAWNDYRARVGLIITLTFILAGTVGTVLVSEPVVMEGDTLLMPWEQPLQFPFGTDGMGRDLFAQIIHSTPAMLKMVAAGGLLSVGVGTLIGVTAGYTGGTVDKVLMTISDTVLTIPALPLIIILAAVYTPKDPFMVGILLGIDNWPGLSRTLRSQVLSIREESFTEASRAMGLSKVTIFRKDVISNMAPYILVNLANSSRRIIFESVGLYYIGVLPFSVLNWGVMLNMAYTSGQMTALKQIHWLLAPMGAIIFVSLGFMLFAQGMDRVFNVRLRAKHAKTRSDEEEAGGEATA
jgi:peptide/nickel transport system permease protein